jgi:hypothetical protein
LEEGYLLDIEEIKSNDFLPSIMGCHVGRRDREQYCQNPNDTKRTLGAEFCG